MIEMMLVKDPKGWRYQVSMSCAENVAKPDSRHGGCLLLFGRAAKAVGIFHRTYRQTGGKRKRKRAMKGVGSREPRLGMSAEWSRMC